MIQALSGNEHVPGVVVGVGSEIPASARRRARAAEVRTCGIRSSLYVGRIDANKGCAELFDLFSRYSAMRYLTLRDREVDLVLIGTPVHRRSRTIRASAISASCPTPTSSTCWRPRRLLVMPSYYESLSMVALEAWALGKPVLANARCDVLLGQCLRSNAGLYYENAEEFGGALDTLLDSPELAAAHGRARAALSTREHYSWPVIERKYLDMFERLTASPPAHQMEPLPGLLERRRRDKPPADDVIASLPSGPVRAPSLRRRER